MNRLLAALAACLAGCAAMPDPLPPSDAPATLAAAESAFAAQSVREGMRAAFLAWLAPDATLFRDGPVNGPATIAAKPDPPIVLDWRPVFVETASSGDLGLSTGPWTMTSRKDPAAAPRHGQFVSVWARDPGGPWRVRVDLGISHPGPALAQAPLEARTTPATQARTAVTIADAEREFSRRARESGDAAAYSASLSPSVRLYREGKPPFLGRAAALGALATQSSRTAWALESQAVAAAGDFGYATGSYGPAEGVTAGHYVRVWRREPGGWRIALDIVEALPPR